MKQKWTAFLQIFTPLLIGGIIGLFLSKSFVSFETLKQPFLAPPKILFPIAWTILYLLIGISYFLYKKDYPLFSFPDFIYYVQLLFNFLWPIFFFLLEWRFFSIFLILLLDFLVLLLIFLYFPKKRISSYLLFPYMVWILFATYLNIAIYIIN